MVRLVPCGVRECRHAVIDRERETETSKTRKEGRTIEHNTYSSAGPSRLLLVPPPPLPGPPTPAGPPLRPRRPPAEGEGGPELLLLLFPPPSIAPAFTTPPPGTGLPSAPPPTTPTFRVGVCGALGNSWSFMVLITKLLPALLPPLLRGDVSALPPIASNSFSFAPPAMISAVCGE
jgi:hypothetical protein